MIPVLALALLSLAGNPLPPAKPDQPPVVAVFCYHHVQPRPDNYIALTPRLLEAQLQRLQRERIVTLAASEIPAWLAHPGNRGKRAACLTFDDGNITVRTRAWPLLRRYGAKATLFIHPDGIGTKGKMSWTQLGEMARAGIDIQCHGMTHESLLKGPRETDRAFAVRMERELGASKRRLERFTGRAVTAFAYPFGWHQAAHLPLLRRLGYTMAFTVNEGVNGPGTHPMLLRRQSVFRSDDEVSLAAKLHGWPAEPSATTPRDLAIVGPSSVTLEALLDRPCSGMWLDFKPVRLVDRAQGGCASGPYDLRPGFHVVAIRTGTAQAPSVTSWSFTARAEGRPWGHPGRPWIQAR
ncbi:MAG: polysaccharide deacetylase family protein [Candidatus Sericytochromatia bacterium]|nr:polysaccharide deacetylase family protein [Candidatus Sericytochromatia bacterium]